MSDKQSKECSWCGAEITGIVFYDSRTDTFCSKSHRDESTRAVRRLRQRDTPKGLQPWAHRSIAKRRILAQRIERPVHYAVAVLPTGSTQAITHNHKLVALARLRHARDPAILLLPTLCAWLQLLGVL